MISNQLNRSAANTHSRASLLAAKNPFEIGGLSNNFNFNQIPAFRLEQREIGFSNSTFLGTIDVNNCIAIAVRDVQTGIVGLAHFDANSNPSSLNTVFDGCGQGPYEAIIVGARFSPDGGHDEWETRTTESNLNSILAAINQRDVTIVGAKIYGDEQPRNFILDPSNFAMMAVDRDFASFAVEADQADMTSFAKQFLGDLQPELEIAFDSRLSPNRLPVPLQREHIEAIRDYVTGKSDEEIESWIAEREGGASGDMIKVIRKAVIRYDELLNEQLSSVGLSIEDDLPEVVYIGSNASAANASSNAENLGAGSHFGQVMT